MKRPSFPTVISLIALFVALGGTSYAVIKLPRNSVGSAQLKPSAVTGAKVRARSIARSDLAPNARSGVRGPRGAVGPTGATGPAGASGAAVEPWKPLVLVSPWADYGDGWPMPAYRKDAAGRVFLRGLIKQGGGLTGGLIAVLPPGYTPPTRSMSNALAAAGGGVVAASRVDIETNGELRYSGGPTGDPNFVNLADVSFWTG